MFQKIGSCYELLEAVRLLCVSLWPEEVQRTSDLRLEMIIRMLKTPHFSARMNALKVCILFLDLLRVGFGRCYLSLHVFLHKIKSFKYVFRKE